VTGATPVVFIVDDDVSVRESLEALVADAGYEPKTFASAHEFLESALPPSPSCLVLDMRLPDLNGLEIQKRVAGDRSHMPIIFMTGHADVPMTVQAMKGGAVEFLTKPFGTDELLAAIRGAIERSNALLAEESNLKDLQSRYASLSARERDVMTLVVRGQMNKQVASELGISEITVKAHRGRAMRKMRVKSLAELVKVAAVLGIPAPGTGT
jgi:FixJ family two-component response regulator